VEAAPLIRILSPFNDAAARLDTVKVNDASPAASDGRICRIGLYPMEIATSTRWKSQP
jgi:hypothetical protein